MAQASGREELYSSSNMLWESSLYLRRSEPLDLLIMTHLTDYISHLPEDKNELREKKQSLKLDKERMDQKIKAMIAPSTRFAPTQQSIYNAAENGTKLMMTLRCYGGYSMWQWIPQTVLDTS